MGNAGLIAEGRSSGKHAYSKSSLDDNQLSAWRSGRFSLEARTFSTRICKWKLNPSRQNPKLLTELSQASDMQSTVSSGKLTQAGREVEKGESKSEEQGVGVVPVLWH
jgi:hypothetical protein